MTLHLFSRYLAQRVINGRINNIKRRYEEGEVIHISSKYREDLGGTLHDTYGKTIKEEKFFILMFHSSKYEDFIRFISENKEGYYPVVHHMSNVPQITHNSNYPQYHMDFHWISLDEIKEDKVQRPLLYEKTSICNKCQKIEYNKMKCCSKCRTVWYCCKECQVDDWQNHKKKCVGIPNS